MSESQATEVARGILRDHVKRLDAEIAWRTEDLVSVKSNVVFAESNLADLKRKRTAVTDAINVHFPVAL